MALLLTCGIITILNVSNLPWNKHDQEVLDRNRNFCYNKFEKSKCVKKFIKVGEQSYHIICGAK